MSLLLDALKKSEAQRRRGTSPTIDLTRTMPSGSPRRGGRRWMIVVMIVILLIAASALMWPRLSDWMESRQADAAAVAEDADTSDSTDAAVTAAESESRAEGSTKQIAVEPIAGASSPRRVAATAAAPAVAAEPAGENDQAPELAGAASSTPSNQSPEDGDAAVPEVAEQAVPEKATAETEAESPRQANEPTENFIRPWELPQAQRAEFPELKLTVHFYTQRAPDRFVLINGERYREGERVGPGTTLVEIRQRGAVVDFGRYRVLIE